jgi:hypothetical protein
VKLIQHLPYFPPNLLAKHLQIIATLQTIDLDVPIQSMDEPVQPTSMQGVRPVQVDWLGAISIHYYISDFCWMYVTNTYRCRH